jgi:hypothetical protein
MNKLDDISRNDIMLRALISMPSAYLHRSYSDLCEIPGFCRDVKFYVHVTVQHESEVKRETNKMQLN